MWAPLRSAPVRSIGSAGPTTSGRMDAYSPRLLDLGQLIMIGKGKRDQAVKDAVVRNGAVYLAALGGAGALMAASVKELEVICGRTGPVRRCAVWRWRTSPSPLSWTPTGVTCTTSGPAAYLASLA